MTYSLIRDSCSLKFSKSLEELFNRGLFAIFHFLFCLLLCSLDLSFFKPTRGNVLRLRLLGGKLGQFPDTSKAFAVSLPMLQESTIIVVIRPLVVVPCPIENSFVGRNSRFSCSRRCCRSSSGSSGGSVVGSVGVWFGHRGGCVVGVVIVRRRCENAGCGMRDLIACVSIKLRWNIVQHAHRICNQGSIDLNTTGTCVVGMYCIYQCQRPLWQFGFKLEMYESRYGLCRVRMVDEAGRDSSPVGKIPKDMPRWTQNLSMALSKLTHFRI